MASAQCSIGSPNMALGPDGKLWVATVQGLAMLDLRRLAVDKSKPKVYVDEAIVGREARPAGRELILPPGTHHVELHFDSISLGWPEKLRFQYRMDDVDPVWLDAGNNRAAVYTSVPIGAHTFHVRACNSSGVWDRTGIIFRVTQKPFFYETVLFRLAMAALFGLLLAAGYKLRVQQVTSQMQARLNERVAERTRVARELHDTLLQTIQASKILADASLDGPADTARMQGTLKRLSEWLGRAVQESRAALSSLRLSAIQHNDIAESLRATAGENCKSGVIDIVFTVEGSGREVHPIVHDEVYRIGCEAIRNACAHSGGSRIDVEISYARDLVLRVRDNGRGIDAQVLAAGKEGHFGLKGIRERADRLGGKLNLNSSSAGTSVELIVPDGLAFSNRRTATGEVRVRVLRFFGLQL